MQVDESRLAIDAAEITQLSESIANSASVALIPFLKQLHQKGNKKVALRVTLAPETVGNSSTQAIFCYCIKLAGSNEWSKHEACSETARASYYVCVNLARGDRPDWGSVSISCSLWLSTRVNELSHY